MNMLEQLPNGQLQTRPSLCEAVIIPLYARLNASRMFQLNHGYPRISIVDQFDQ